MSANSFKSIEMDYSSFDFGDLLDLQSTIDKSWKVAKVVEKDPLRGIKVEHTRTDKRLTEWLLPTSPRIALFRVRSKCGEPGDCVEASIDLEEIRKAQDWMAQGIEHFFNYQDCKSIIQFYRGVVYGFAVSLLSKASTSAAEFQAGTEFLKSVVSLAEKWVLRLLEILPMLQTIQTCPETIYTDAQLANASIWPELFKLIEIILGTSSRPLGFHTVSSTQSKFAKEFCASEGFPSFEEYMWSSCVQQQFMVNLSAMLFDEKATGNVRAAMWIMEEIPLWDYIRTHSFDQERSCEYLFTSLLTLLRAWQATENDYDKYCDLQKLWKIVLSSRRHMLTRDFTGEAEEILQSMFLMVQRFLSTTTLEKKVSAALTLDSIVKQSDTCELSESLLRWVESSSVLDFFLKDPHPQVLQRSFQFLQWIRSQGWLPTEEVLALFRSAVGSHESYSECVYDLIVELSQQFTEDDIEQLSREIIESGKNWTDPSLLKFATRFLDTLPAQSSSALSFATHVTEALGSTISSEAASPIAVQTFVRLLRLPCLRDCAFDKAISVFREYFASEKQGSAEVIYHVLYGFRGEEGLIDRVVKALQRELKREIGTLMLAKVGVVLKLETAESRKETTWLLKCLDQFACFTAVESHYDRIDCCFSVETFRRLFLLICSEGSSSACSDFLAFLDECSETSTWCHSGLLMESFDSLRDQRLQRFLTRLTMPQYDALVRLFLRANKHRINSEMGCYLQLEYESLHNLAEFCLLATRPLDAEIRQTARTQINAFLVFNSLPNTELVNIVISTMLEEMAESDEERKLACLAVFKDLITFEQKYREKRWTESELQDCIAAHVRELKLSGYEKEEAEANLKVWIEKNAKKKDLHYMQVKLFRGQNSKNPLDLFITYRQYKPVSLAALINTENIVSRLSLNSPHLKVFEAALWVIMNLISQSRLSRELETLGATYQAMFRGMLEKRLLCFIALRELSTNSAFCDKYSERASDLLELLNLLSFDEGTKREFVKNFRMIVLLYYEVLLTLIKVHFTDRGRPLDPDSIIKAMDSLTIMSIYYSLPNTEKSFKTNLLSIAGEILASSLSQSDMAAQVAESLPLAEFCQQALIHSESQEFSRSVSNFVIQICDKDAQFVHYFIEVLARMGREAVERPDECRSFFALLGILIMRGDASELANTDVQWLKSVVIPLLQGSTLALTGKLWVLSTGLLPLFTPEEVELLTKEALSRLFLRSETDPTAADEDARDTSLQFIMCAMKGYSELTESVLRELSPFHRDMSWRKPRKGSWELTPVAESPGRYRGMHNPGAICYMNSTFQQLFAVESFTSRILAVDPPQGSALLAVFQTIMAKLKFKWSGTVSAEAVLYSLRSHPIDQMEQTDIEEFLNECMHVLETQLASTGEKDLVEQHFKGATLRRLAGKAPCVHVRESKQAFLTLALGIKAKRNLQESLSELTRGEILTDALDCSQCGEKVPTESTYRILHLPNVLIIALRRFDYNLEAGQRYKINDYYEFPFDLDMKDSCTSQSFPADYYQYRLQGVVVHMGSAETGHYYSLIRRGEKWTKFDDTSVQDFDEKTMEAEAFGGRKTAGSEYQKNAYLLIYVRSAHYAYRETESALVAVTLAPAESLSASAMAVQMKAVEKQEMRRKLRHLLSEPYLRFVTQVLRHENQPTKALSFALSFFFTVHCHRKNWVSDKQLFPALLQRVTEVPGISFWMAEVLSFGGVVDELLIAAPMAAKKTVIILFRAVLPTATPSAVKCLLQRLMVKVESLPDCTSKDVSQVFELLYYAVMHNPEEASRLRVCERLVAKLIVDAQSEPQLSDKPPLYDSSAYLGHPCKEYTSIEVKEKAHIGFHLLILNTLLSSVPHTRTYFLEHIGAMRASIWDVQTTFEVEEVAKLLKFNGEDTTSLLDSLEATYYTNLSESEEARFLFVLQVAVSNPEVATRVRKLLLRPGDSHSCTFWHLTLNWAFSATPDSPEWTKPESIQCIRERLASGGYSQHQINSTVESLYYRMSFKTAEKLRECHYGVVLPQGTRVRILSQPLSSSDGKVIQSYEVVHVVQLDKTGEEFWVAAEADLNFI